MLFYQHLVNTVWRPKSACTIYAHGCLLFVSALIPVHALEAHQGRVRTHTSTIQVRFMG